MCVNLKTHKIIIIYVSTTFCDALQTENLNRCAHALRHAIHSREQNQGKLRACWFQWQINSGTASDYNFLLLSPNRFVKIIARNSKYIGSMNRVNSVVRLLFFPSMKRTVSFFAGATDGAA